MSESGETTMQGDKAIRRAHGSDVLYGESGNPQLGVVVTPDPRGLIVCLPGGPQPLGSVAVRLGHRQCAVLAELATGVGATPAARDDSNGNESVQALEQAAREFRMSTADDALATRAPAACAASPTLAEPPPPPLRPQQPRRSAPAGATAVAG